MIGLIALHRGLRSGVPRSRRLTLHVVLADERGLNLPGASRVNRLLAVLPRNLLGALLAAGAFALLRRGAPSGCVPAGAMLCRGGLRRFRWRSRRRCLCDCEPM